MAKVKLTDTEQVNQHIEKLPAQLAETVSFLRTHILAISPEIGEHIKWNSVAFYFKGDMAAFDAKEYKRDLLVLNLSRGHVLMVLPTGAVVNDTTGVLEGNYADGRRMITIKTTGEAQQKAEAIKVVINNWLQKVER